MFLAPFNYNRFFERIFEDLNIARQFIEALLDVKIEYIALLARKNKMTDDGAYVEFDFRCKIYGKYVIIDMQQFYKQDVVKRFYVYFCNSTSLQLERIPELSVRLSDRKTYKTKNYHHIEPTITIIWMVSDALGFEDDIVGFSLLPEMMDDFIQNEALWAAEDFPILLEKRKELVKKANNKTKGIDFLRKNRLIYAFQSNIAKNKNGKMNKYYRWFEFAEKTRNPDNVEADFTSFKNEPVFMELMEKLRTDTMSHDDFQYIEDYAEYERGVAVYNEKMRDEGREEGREEGKVKGREEGWVQATEHYQTILQQAEAEKKRLEQESITKQLALLRKLLERGVPFDDIEDILEIDEPTLAFLVEEIKAENAAKGISMIINN